MKLPAGDSSDPSSKGLAPRGASGLKSIVTDRDYISTKRLAPRGASGLKSYEKVMDYATILSLAPRGASGLKYTPITARPGLLVWLREELVD